MAAHDPVERVLSIRGMRNRGARRGTRDGAGGPACTRRIVETEARATLSTTKGRARIMAASIIGIDRGVMWEGHQTKEIVEMRRSFSGRRGPHRRLGRTIGPGMGLRLQQQPLRQRVRPPRSFADVRGGARPPYGALSRRKRELF
jgi:hypothetical protein